MLIGDNPYTYHAMLKELHIESESIHKIIHKELNVKKLIFHCVPHLTEYQKT